MDWNVKFLIIIFPLISFSWSNLQESECPKDQDHMITPVMQLMDQSVITGYGLGWGGGVGL